MSLSLSASGGIGCSPCAEGEKQQFNPVGAIAAEYPQDPHQHEKRPVCLLILADAALFGDRGRIEDRISCESQGVRERYVRIQIALSLKNLVTSVASSMSERTQHQELVHKVKTPKTTAVRTSGLIEKGGSSEVVAPSVL